MLVHPEAVCGRGDFRLVHGLSRLKYVQDLIIYQGLDFFFFQPEKQLRGAGEMAYQLGSLAALPEYLGSVPITHTAAPNCNFSLR